MVIAISIVGFLSILTVVISYPKDDRYYARLTREDQQTSFYPLSQAQLIEDDPIAIDNPQRDHDSIEFMVAPVRSE
uniref:APP_amyloid domain-containing protein n=1 Tax=Heterorhabditis bacteriophora TaxID=37862 RepID=A0A1I7W9N3_HETBA